MSGELIELSFFETFSDLFVLLLFSSFVLTMLYTRLLALSRGEC